MNLILIGSAALGVGALGLVFYAVRFSFTRTLSLATLWIIVPLLGAIIAFLLTPPSLLTVSLGGASVALAFLTLAATLMVPAIMQGGGPESAEANKDSRDRS